MTLPRCPPSPTHAALLAAGGVALAFALTACAAIWGFEDPQDPASSPALVGDGAVAEGRAPGCEDEKPDETNGVFVVGNASANGEGGAVDDPLCGSKDSPCVHIAVGLSRAKDLGKTLVYVIRGTYTESLTISDAITIEGGWNALKTGGSISYAKACSDAPGTAVTLQAPPDQATAVLVSDPSGPVSLSDLTIRSKVTAAPSESVYALRIKGAATTPVVTLTDVLGVSANAGAGTPGTDGAVGAAATGSCTPPFDTSGGAVTPPQGDAGAPGDAAATPSFGADGITAATGSPGNPGSDGYDGPPSTPPTPVDCLTACKAPATVGDCTGTASGAVTGAPGGSGCGGHGGGQGAGGTGGGSSVALFVWNAKVTITRGSFTAGNGGAGALGGAGQSGGKGALGANGATSASCINSCGMGLLGITSCSSSMASSPGTTGTQGGVGGTGGAGGPGVGGDSFAIASGGNAVVTVDPKSTALQPGAPGGAAMGGVQGKAAPLQQGMP